MEHHFWHQRWETGNTPFHEPEANPILVAHFDKLALRESSRVFVPLCGKTRDIHWLLSRGYCVAGAELSPLAIEQLFVDLGVTPQIVKVGALQHYSAEALDIFVGDIFELSAETLGTIDAIYDRAALVALPESMRTRYTTHLMALTNRAPQLLITFVYDQSLQEGPPFSIPAEEVHRHYAEHYELSQVASLEVPGGLKGICPAQESVWMLR